MSSHLPFLLKVSVQITRKTRLKAQHTWQSSFVKHIMYCCFSSQMSGNKVTTSGFMIQNRTDLHFGSIPR